MGGWGIGDKERKQTKYNLQIKPFLRKIAKGNEDIESVKVMFEFWAKQVLK